MANYTLKSLGATVVRKGEGEVVLSKIMRNSMLLQDAIKLNEKSDMVILGVHQNGANYYTAGSVNIANQKDAGSISFRNGKDNGRVVSIDNEELPYITNAGYLLLENYNKLKGTLYCDKEIASEVLQSTVDEVNDYLNFCRKYNQIDDMPIQEQDSEELITLQTIEEYAKSPSLFQEQDLVSPDDLFKYLQNSIEEEQSVKQAEIQQIQNQIRQEQSQGKEAQLAPQNSPS